MRMVSYNILDGGEGRADPLAEIIISRRPDVVALVEADNPAVVDRIAARLEMNAVTGAGKRHSVALLCRGMILESINHAPLMTDMSGCFLEGLVRVGGSEWRCGVVHLHPRAGEADERQREKEIAGILEITRLHRGARRPHFLMGDFNANSPVQKIDPERCKPATRKSWEENGGAIPRRAVQMLLDAGYVDTMAAVQGAAAGEMYSFTTQFPGQRLDYIFSFAVAVQQLKAAWVEDDRLARYASDHYPVGVEL